MGSFKLEGGTLCWLACNFLCSFVFFFPFFFIPFLLSCCFQQNKVTSDVYKYGPCIYLSLYWLISLSFHLMTNNVFDNYAHLWGCSTITSNFFKILNVSPTFINVMYGHIKWNDNLLHHIIVNTKSIKRKIIWKDC